MDLQSILYNLTQVLHVMAGQSGTRIAREIIGDIEGVNIAKGIDNYLPDKGPIRISFRLFLFSFEFLSIFSRKFKPFTKLDTTSKHRYIESWINSNSKYKKGIFVGIKKAIFSAFYDDKKVSYYIGYEEICK